MADFTLSRIEEAEMDVSFVGPSPGGSDGRDRLRNVIDFWNAISRLDGAGETTPGS